MYLCSMTTQTDRVRQVALPPDARAQTTLPRLDYHDAFLVDVGPTDDRTAEAWARAILEDAPLAVRSSLLSGWLSLGLQLGSPRSAQRVLGWEVRRSTADVVLLGAESRLGLTGELLLMRRPRTLLFATLVQQRHAAARALWATVEPVHVPIVRRILRQAADRVTQDAHEVRRPRRPAPG